VFAAGIILWELLAGRRLYRVAEDQPLIEVARRAEVPALPARDLPQEAELHAIVCRALCPDPQERFPSAVAMLRALGDYTARAHLVASPLRFGGWLMDHFGQNLVTARRSRERAVRALSLGPPVRIEPIGQRGADGVMVPMQGRGEDRSSTADSSPSEPPNVATIVGGHEPDDLTRAAGAERRSSSSQSWIFYGLALGVLTAAVFYFLARSHFITSGG
jgi:serine/threonine-protein kinase